MDKLIFPRPDLQELKKFGRNWTPIPEEEASIIDINLNLDTRTKLGLMMVDADVNLSCLFTYLVTKFIEANKHKLKEDEKEENK